MAGDGTNNNGTTDFYSVACYYDDYGAIEYGRAVLCNLISKNCDGDEYCEGIVADCYGDVECSSDAVCLEAADSDQCYIDLAIAVVGDANSKGLTDYIPQTMQDTATANSRRLRMN